MKEDGPDEVSRLAEEIEHLRGGEEDGAQEGFRLTPGQILKKIHDLEGDRRIDFIQSLMESARVGQECVLGMHGKGLAASEEQARILWQLVKVSSRTRRLLGVYVRSLREAGEGVIDRRETADQLTSFMADGFAADESGKHPRILCGHSWREAGQILECAEPVDSSGAHIGPHSAWVNEGTMSDRDLQVQYLEQDNAEMRRKLGLPPRSKRAAEE